MMEARMEPHSLRKELEEAFEAPAEVLQEGIQFVKKEERALIRKRPFKLAE